MNKKQTQAFFSSPKGPVLRRIEVLQRRQCIRPMVLAICRSRKIRKMEVAEGTIDIIRCQVMAVNVPHEGFYAK